MKIDGAILGALIMFVGACIMVFDSIFVGLVLWIIGILFIIREDWE